MRFSKQNKKIPPPGEWLVLSLTSSVLTCSIMWYLHGALWGIVSLFFTMAFFWIHYYNKKQKHQQEENHV